jgi:hypothetical protein
MTSAEFRATPTQERDMDLTQITTPFGLLDDKTRAALQSHGGPYEICIPFGAWVDIGDPRWGPGLVYRVKPQQPTKPSVDWSHVAPEYKWLARDLEGAGWLYGEKPRQREDDWFPNKGKSGRAQLFASYTPGTCDWRDSLVQRPEDV